MSTGLVSTVPEFCLFVCLFSTSTNTVKMFLFRMEEMNKELLSQRAILENIAHAVETNPHRMNYTRDVLNQLWGQAWNSA